MRELLINEQIREKEVRLNYDGGTHGVVSLSEALEKAYDAGLDLVLIAPQANPPVAKIMDYGKYRFELLRRQKEAKKKQKVNEIKGMQLRLNTAEHDMSYKAKNVRRFLLNGDKVRVSLRMHGRQLANPQQAIPVLNTFAELVSDVGEITSKPVVNGRIASMVLSPIKK